ncbi:flagellar hook assembly protein FlgD [Rhodocyclus gracilis]|uniref:Basal-body rod modification protein FlgD n=1 Tax=Rhodocyclus tenuis TaxID=1066 RepID=A0A6L5JW51_RHOTE|nr:flagellar hook assembly protein FlgD [Rhodocyclus gracilis]MQY51607.1 flagellar biosynthesis protein FlgD [Rhodocyclus gracilis]
MATVQSSTETDPYAAINALGSSSTKTTSTTQDAQDRFLTLLVTQLKNQDPLNPLDNAQVTTQLAQINTVSGIEKLNSTLTSLMSTYNDGQAMQAAGMIGSKVLVPGSQMTLATGSQAVGCVSLASAADKVTVTITDANGTVVQTQDLGAQAAGTVTFGWDGKSADGTAQPAGTYKLAVTASNGGTAVTATPMQIGTVSSVTRTSGGFQLDLGTLGKVDFSKVQQIF